MPLFLLITFILFFFVNLEGATLPLEEIFKEISKEDRENISSLFAFLIKQDHFAYTLFGDKPLSLSSHFVLTPWENIIEHINSSDELFWKKWKIWKKYEHLFPLNNYLLLKEESRNNNYQMIYLILINKEEFIKTLKKNLTLFQAILNKTIIPEEFLKEIELGKISFVDSINDHQMLWGILLGYGKYNAMLYNKRERNYFDCFILSDIAIQKSNIKLSGCGDHTYYPFLIEPVSFVGDLNHSETRKLRKKYQKLRGKISALYAKGDLLEVTLSQLTAGKRSD